MSRPTQPPIGTCSQFVSTKFGMLACLIVGHDNGKLGLKIRYRRPDTGEVVEDAFISVFDLISDEDVAIHDPSIFE